FNSGPMTGSRVPWGDVASAYHSTGIPNIEVYLAAPKGELNPARLRTVLRWVVKFKFLHRMVEKKIGEKLFGPDEESRVSGRSEFWGEVRNARGEAVSGWLEAPSGYQLTMLSAVAAVTRM